MYTNLPSRYFPFHSMALGLFFSKAYQLMWTALDSIVLVDPQKLLILEEHRLSPAVHEEFSPLGTDQL